MKYYSVALALLVTSAILLACAGPTAAPETTPAATAVVAATPNPPPAEQTVAATPSTTETPTPEGETPAGVLSPLNLHATEDINSELTETELACLKESGIRFWQTWAFTLSGPGNQEERLKIIGCLHDETVARVFLADLAQGIGPLSPEASTCVRAAFNEIDPRAMLLANVEGYPEDTLHSATVLYLATTACLGDYEWENAPASLREDSELREWMQCMMEKMGGPGGIAAAMTKGKEDEQKALEEAAAVCGEDMGPKPSQAPFAPVATPESASTSEPEGDAPSSSQQRQAMTGSRIDMVRDRGYLICASRNDVPGWGWLDREGNDVGFDIDLCRAVAAAVLGDPNATEIHLITAAQRGPNIQSGEVDLMVRTVTWTTSRDASWGTYAQIMFYDGQGFMVRKDAGINSALELHNLTVCVVSRTTTEWNLHDFSRRNGLNLKILAFEDTVSALQAYEEEERCEAYTNDHSQLAPLRTYLPAPDDHVILPEFISEEPLAPLVPHGDEQWADIVRAVMGILIWAEAHSITSGAVPTTPTGSAAVDRLLGLEGAWGQRTLGLSQAVARDVIEAVGNYGEIYDRNLGTSGLGIVRENSRNALWLAAPCTDCPKGGQIYAPPLR